MLLEPSAHQVDAKLRPIGAVPPGGPAAASRWQVVVIALVAFLTFANSLGNYFMLDDFLNLDTSLQLKWTEVFQPFHFGGAEEYGRFWFNASRVSGQSGEAYFRPLVSIAYKALGTIFGFDARAFHLSSVALHVVMSLVVFWLARMFFRRPEPAFIMALAFAVHPAHAEPVQWLAANTHLIVGPFYLLALGLFLRSRDPDGRPWQYAAALACFVAALCSHELAVTLPAVLLLADWWLARDAASGFVALGRVARRVMPFAIIGGAYLIWHFDVVRAMHKEMAGSAYLHDLANPVEFARTSLFQLTYGLSHLFVPLPFAPVDARDLDPLIGKAPLAAACLAVLALLAWLWSRMGGRDLRVLFAAALFVIPFAPSLLVAPAERQLYVPSVGFCLLLGLCYERLTAEGRSLRVPVIVLAAIGLILAWSYNVMWSFPSNVARAQIEELSRQLPAPEKGSSIYLLNLWGPAFGMEMMPMMLTGDRTLDVQVLTIHPKLLPVGEYRVSNPLLQRFFAAVLPGATGEAPVEATWESHDILRVQIRHGRFMRSLIEQTYPAAAAAQTPDSRIEMPHFTAEVVAADANGVETLRFHFQPGWKRQIFDLQGGKVRRISAD
ncbi:hypothetical protein AYO41_01930 [Verrucomicrobia bacterium SCGC AG-212-E04]|nr:hypothetical protein AYO41_01930 [Verrucomicrobia bacterium SCGC AG-212-E04]